MSTPPLARLATGPVDLTAIPTGDTPGLLLDTLRELGPQWPHADLDVAAERKRLKTEAPVS